MYKIMKPKIIAIVGPTASGKSSLAAEIAKKFNGEILCVDSRTVYRGMDIGTAKSEGERITNVGEYTNCKFYEYTNIDGIRNYGLDLVDLDEEMNGALFKEYAEKIIAEILERGHLPILVGGTGLWFDMIIDNLEMPEVEPDLVLRAELEKRSEEELFAEFEKIDPVGAEVIDKHNKRRLVRALEVCKKTGRLFSELRKKGQSKYDCLWLGIDWPKEVLDERINRRVDEMVAVGVNGYSPLIEEVKQLKEKYGCVAYAMSGIGYQEICEHYRRGEWPFTPTVITEISDEIKKNTRQYAKRQRTWFKRNKNIRWVKVVTEAEELVNDWI